MTDQEPDAVFVIQDLETLQIVSEPLRSQIYEILTGAAYTIRQVGERLGQPASRLYYHVNRMEKCGLLRVVDTRPVANMVEKVYRAAAYHLTMAPDLFNFASEEGPQSVSQMMANVVDATREDMLRSFNARLVAEENGAPKPPMTMISRSTARIPEPSAEAFRRRLKALIDEFKDQSTTGDASEVGIETYALMVAFYPSLYFPPEE